MTLDRAAVADYHKLVLGLKTTKTSSLVVLEARSPEFRYLQGCCPPEGTRENPSLPLVASGGSGCSLACGCLTQSLPVFIGIFVSPCLSLTSTFVFGFRPQPKSRLKLSQNP